jgi:hypothetical protein
LYCVFLRSSVFAWYSSGLWITSFYQKSLSPQKENYLNFVHLFNLRNQLIFGENLFNQAGTDLEIDQMFREVIDKLQYISLNLPQLMNVFQKLANDQTFRIPYQLQPEKKN